MAGRKISIIVPVYKAEAYLRRCVDSLISQTYRELEIILVDDGSPDQSPAMCDAYAAGDRRIQVIHKENGGLVSAWQAGVRASTGAYLCFVDSDDWVETDMIEGMAAYLSKDELKHSLRQEAETELQQESETGSEDEPARREIICCNFVINRPGRETKHYHALAPGEYEGELLQGKIKDHLLGHENRTISMSRCMKLFSRGLIEENMKYCNPRITMAEDVNITLPALLDCERVVIMKDALYYHYFYNEESMVHKYDAGMYEGIGILYRTIREIFQEKKRDSGEQQADKEYIYLLLLALKNEIRSAKTGYRERVREISLAEENRKLILANRISVQDKTNRLLYSVLKHPWNLWIVGVRLVFWVYDLRNGG